MVEVAPFKGIMYNKDKVGKLDDVMSPPYDIISPEMQEELYRKNDYNVVRLILGKVMPGDNEKDNWYKRARKLFEEWLKEGILVESKKEGIYPYSVRYTIDGEEKEMKGFFILLKLDHDYKAIKAHERTLAKPKEDRLRLMRETKANLEPIELLYMDESDEIMRTIRSNLDGPEIDVVGYDGFRHMLWRIEDEDVITQVKNLLKDKILFIADGHHRYQTAIDYAKEVNAGENDPENYIMVVLANMFDKGLTILPTHRLIRSKMGLDEIERKAGKYFEIEKIDVEGSISDKSREIVKSIETEEEHKFALYSRKGCSVYTLKDENIMEKFAPDKSETWRTLDVTILHKLLIEDVMGIKDVEKEISYTRDAREAIGLVEEGKFDLSVIMNPTKIEEVRRVAEAGEHMPQKSTYFMPKLLSGLVMRRF
ncbi:MAG: hypothetical protein DRN00_01145 [Thermoplasmata archaeon]|nr:MAG: hypothetical protein DRN03_02155 [Thermoplasmata archaeon]RLF39747.1 MAG: hypothetical protein DRN00_01145 [Thermoplasmata archaeon]